MALKAQISPISNSLGSRQVLNIFFYWLVKINVMKKSAKMLCCPHSQSSKDLWATLFKRWVNFMHFLRFKWYGLAVGKHKICQTHKHTVLVKRKISLSVLSELDFRTSFTNFRGKKNSSVKHLAHHVQIKAYPAASLSTFRTI